MSKSQSNEPIKSVEKSEQLLNVSAQMELDKQKLTYICDYCGKVNDIVSLRCARCGKRRPRKEYIDAIKAHNEINKAGMVYGDAVGNSEVVATDKQAESFQTGIVEEEKASSLGDIGQAEIVEEEKVSSLDDIGQADTQEQFMEAVSPQENGDKIRKENEDLIVEGLPLGQDAINIINKIVAEQKEKAKIKLDDGINAKEDLSERDFAINPKPKLTKEQAEKEVARLAVQQIVEAEKVAEDALISNKDALNRATIKRIESQKEATKQQVYADYITKKEDIEQEFLARKRAEAQPIKKVLEERKAILDNPVPSRSIATNQVAINSTGQYPQIAQPFIIVPYVNSQHPLLQYKPNQLYRFVPNTQQVANNTVNSQIASDNVDSGNNDVEQDIDTLPTKQKSKFGGRLLSILILLFILFMGVTFFVLPIIKENIFSDTNTNLSIFASLLNFTEEGINSMFKLSLASFQPNNYVNFIREVDCATGIVLPIGLFLAIVLYLILFVVNFIKVCSQKTMSKLGTVLAILAFVAVQIAVVGVFLIATHLGLEFLPNVGVAFYIAELVSIVILVLSLLAYKSESKL